MGLFLILGLILLACAGFPLQAAVASLVIAVIVGWAQGAK